MIGRCLLMVAMLLPTWALAEVVPVQLGEHGGYTRLALTVSNTEDWAVRETETGLSITVPSATGFDTADLGDLAGSRVSYVAQAATDDTLTVALTCDCTAHSYLLDGQFLTIDISPRVAAPTAFPLNGGLAGLGQPWHTPLAQELTQPQPDIAPQRPTEPSPPDALDTAISTGLAAATYQGFLDLRELDGSTANAAPDISAEILDNIAVGIESQLSTLNAGQAAIPDADSFSCEAVATRLDTSWTDTHSFNIQLGMVRSRIMAAEDDSTIDRDAQLDLAILLVGHGLGHEAVAALSEIGGEVDLTKALKFMAQVIDDPTPPALIGLENCPESLAFWAFLQVAGDQDRIAELDPRSLMLTYKLLPEPLQNRLVEPFGAALARAGHRDFQAELQDFKNTYLTVSFADSGAPPPVIDFETPASARDILRADLTETDLDPAQATPHDPTRLDLELLDSLRMERRGSAAEPALLDAVLARHVEDNNHFAVINLLLDGAARLDPETMGRLTETHLGESIAAMSQPELLAFAYRATLPPMSNDLRAEVGARLADLQIRVPETFETRIPPAEQTQSDALLPAPAFELPTLVRAPEDAMPTFTQTEDLLAGSAAMRNAIETLINDTNNSSQ